MKSERWPLMPEKSAPPPNALPTPSAMRTFFNLIRLTYLKLGSVMSTIRCPSAPVHCLNFLAFRPFEKPAIPSGGLGATISSRRR